MSNFEFETRVNNTIRHSEQAEQRVKAERTRLMRGAGEESPLIKKSAFSLMEMMTVMLVVSVIMALSAPMITKKNAGDVSIRSLWTALTGGHIGYNLGGESVTAIIGGDRGSIETMGTPIPRLTLATNDDKPHIGFMYGGSVAGRLTLRNNGIELGNGASIGTDPDSSVAIGNNAKTTKHHAVAIGRGTEAALGGVAVGDEAKAEDYAVAIGDSNNGATPAIRTSAGSYSVALGYASQTSTSAVAIGNQAQATGANSIAIGTSRYIGGGYYPQTTAGESSIAFGAAANASNPYSIAIGSAHITGGISGYTQAMTNSIAIGTGASTTGSHAVAMGAPYVSGSTSKVTSAVTNSVSIGTGATTTQGASIAIGVLSSSKLSGVAIGNRAIAANHAIAIGSKNALSGGSETNASKDDAIAIGYGTQASGYNAISIGSAANTTAESSIAIGRNAHTVSTPGQSSPTNAIAIGEDATVNGSMGLAIGHNTYANTSGIAIGSDSLYTNNGYYPQVVAKGQKSIAIGTGAQALGTNSISIGTGANWDWLNTPGYEGAIAIGTKAHSAYINSIAIGPESRAGDQNNNKSGIAIGYKANATGFGSTAIGFNAKATATNQIVLGNNYTTTYIPGNLVVGGNIYVANNSYLGFENYTADVFVRNWSSNKNGYFKGMRVGKNDDNTYYWGNSPSNDIHPDMTQTGDGGDRRKYQYMPSDRRLKDIIGENLDAMDKINKLKVYNYTYKKDDLKTPHVGVVAQELEKIFPNAISKDENGFLQIRHEDMFYAMINALKELDAKIKKLATEVTNGFESLKLQAKQSTSDVAKLNARIDKQDKEIKALKKEIAELKKLIK